MKRGHGRANKAYQSVGSLANRQKPHRIAQVAWSSSHFAEAIRSCLESCGHDPDTVQVAIGCEGDAAAAFTKDERIAHLTFIGSDGVGKLVAKSAAEAMTPVTLELGGKVRRLCCQSVEELLSPHPRLMLHVCEFGSKKQKDPLILLASADIHFFQDTFMKAVLWVLLAMLLIHLQAP